MEVLIDEPDDEWLMIDASHCKVHPHAAGAKGGNQDMSRTKGAQHNVAFGRGFAWYAGQGYCYRRDNSRLHSSPHIDRGVNGRVFAGR